MLYLSGNSRFGLHIFWFRYSYSSLLPICYIFFPQKPPIIWLLQSSCIFCARHPLLLQYNLLIYHLWFSLCFSLQLYLKQSSIDFPSILSYKWCVSLVPQLSFLSAAFPVYKQPSSLLWNLTPGVCFLIFYSLVYLITPICRVWSTQFWLTKLSSLLMHPLRIVLLTSTSEFPAHLNLCSACDAWEGRYFSCNTCVYLQGLSNNLHPISTFPMQGLHSQFLSPEEDLRPHSFEE